MVIDPGGLVAVRAPASQAWIYNLDGEQLSGSPIAVDDALIIATSAGRISTIAQESGELRNEMHFNQPLASGPSIVDGRVAVRAADGAVLFAEVPR
jgi:hypothetical protein